jgi:hypothetical protein
MSHHNRLNSWRLIEYVAKQRPAPRLVRRAASLSSERWQLVSDLYSSPRIWKCSPSAREEDMDECGHAVVAREEEDVVAADHTEAAALDDPRQLALHALLDG